MLSSHPIAATDAKLLIVNNNDEDAGNPAVPPMSPEHAACLQRLLAVGSAKLSDELIELATLIACEAPRAEQDLAIMTYFAGRDPQKLEQVVAPGEIAVSSWRLQEAFTLEVRTRLEALSRIAPSPGTQGSSTQGTSIQDPEQLIFAQLPIHISALLIDRRGCVNQGLIPLLEQRLGEELGVSDEQERWHSLLGGLRAIYRNAALRQAIESIEGPCHTDAELVVRSCLALPAASKVSSTSMRLAALSALLYRLHQGRIGSCFSTSICRAAMSTDPLRCLQDFTALLKEGKLTRYVDGKPLSFPIVHQLPKAHGDRLIDISSSEQISSSYGLRAAARVVGLAWARLEQAPLGQQSVERLLARCAGDKDAAALLFAFEAQTTHALVKVWDNCVASMAEAEAHGVVTKRLLDGLQSGWLDQTSNVLQHCQTLEEKIHCVVRQAILARRQYLYFPSMSNGNVGEDGRSIAAAFVLYDRVTQERIDSPATFCAFLARCLHDAQAQLEDDSQHFIRTGLGELHRLISLGGAGERLAKYYPNAGRGQLPWLDYASNSPRAILKVYLELNELPARQTLRPKRAEALLGHLIDWLKSRPEEDKQRLRTGPEVLVPVSTAGQHAFCLRPAAPSLKRAWSAQYPEYTQEWIQQKLIDPGRAIARQPAPPPLKQAFSAHLDPDKLPSQINMTDYRDRLLERSLLHGQSPAKLHTQLFSALPQELRELLLSSAITIADSNWRSGTAALSLAFMFNPFSDRLELWEIDDEGRARGLDQDFWLLRRQWLFYPEGLSFFT